MKKWVLAILNAALVVLVHEGSTAHAQNPPMIQKIAQHRNGDLFSDELFRAVAIKPPWLYALERDGDLFVFKFPNTYAPNFLFGVGDGFGSFFGARAVGEFYDEDSPLVFVKKIVDAGDGQDIAIRDNALLLSSGGKLNVFDLNDPSTPRPVGKFGPDEGLDSVSIVLGKEAAFVLGLNAISTFDISNPTTPQFLGTLHNGLRNWNGCIVGTRLYVAVISFDDVNHPGIAVYDASDPGALAERHFVETERAAYHLFINSDNHLIACLDSTSNFHWASGNNFKVDGDTQIFELDENNPPKAVVVIGNSGGRLACQTKFKGETYLFFNGFVYASAGKTLEKAYSFFPWGSTSDSHPYGGDASGNFVALAAGDTISLFRIGNSGAYKLGKGLAPALLFSILQPL